MRSSCLSATAVVLRFSLAGARRTSCLTLRTISGAPLVQRRSHPAVGISKVSLRISAAWQSKVCPYLCPIFMNFADLYSTGKTGYKIDERPPHDSRSSSTVQGGEQGHSKAASEWFGYYASVRRLPSSMKCEVNVTFWGSTLISSWPSCDLRLSVFTGTTSIYPFVMDHFGKKQYRLDVWNKLYDRWGWRMKNIRKKRSMTSRDDTVDCPWRISFPIFEQDTAHGTPDLMTLMACDCRYLFLPMLKKFLRSFGRYIKLIHSHTYAYFSIRLSGLLTIRSPFFYYMIGHGFLGWSSSVVIYSSFLVSTSIHRLYFLSLSHYLLPIFSSCKLVGWLFDMFSCVFLIPPFYPQFLGLFGWYCYCYSYWIEQWINAGSCFFKRWILSGSYSLILDSYAVRQPIMSTGWSD